MRAIMTVGRIYVVFGGLVAIACILQGRFFPRDFQAGNVVSSIAAITMLLPGRRFARPPTFRYLFAARVLAVAWFAYWTAYFASDGFISFELFSPILFTGVSLFVGPSVVALVLLTYERRRLTTG